MKKLYNRFLMSVGMFSRFPAPHADFSDGTAGILGPLPAVGLLIGLVWYGAALLCSLVSPFLSGAALALLPFLLSGFLHLDGFLDVTDAVLSGRPAEEKLRILKDPHCGAFAVCGAASLLLLDFGAAAAISGGRLLPLLIFVPVLSRALSGLATLRLPVLKTSGLASAFQTDSQKSDLFLLVFFLVLSVCAMVATGGPAGAACSVCLTLAETLSGRYATKQLGGFSGDVAGFMLVLGEAAALFSIAVMEGVLK